jgi:hypothetical protein
MSLRRSTEYGGLGQSGYTAGRQLPDPALELELQARYTAFPHQLDAEQALGGELDTDDRWTGRGGPALREDGAPADPAAEAAPSRGT